MPLRELLTERVGLPVYVDNDASCAALAESFEDGHFTCEELVMFTIGTGVGGGTVLGGRLYRGATGAAPEVGHTIIGLDLTDGAPEDPGDFPQPGSLEALASGRALDRLAVAAAHADPGSFLGQRARRATARSPATTRSTARRRATRARSAACASSASASGSGSPTRSTSTTRSRS